MRRILKKALSIIVSSAVVFSLCAVLPVGAAGGGTMVEITKESQVVDTMTYGGKTVRALYHPIDKLTSEEVFSDETYSCAALVKKFYKTVFSIDMDWLMPGNDPTALNAEFVKTSAPKAGDIYMCSNHWAIVKKVSGSTVTLFEQNWCWLGGEKGNTTYAQYGRTVDTKSLDKDIGETFYTVDKNINSDLLSSVSAAVMQLAAVTSFKAASVGAASISLTWNKLKGAEGYIIYKYDELRKTWVRLIKTASASTTYTVSKLNGGATYKFAVKAYKTVNGKEITSSSFPTVSATTLLPIVSGFKTSSVSQAAVKLTWNKIANADGYIVYKYDNSKKTWVRVKKTTTAGNTYTVSGLRSATSYKFAIKAYKTVNGKEITSVSFPHIETVTKLSSVKPSGQTVGKYSVKTAWNKISGVDGYIVYKYNNSKKTWVRTAKTTALNYTYKNLSSNTSYKFTVKAYKYVNGKEITSASFTPVTVKTKK